MPLFSGSSTDHFLADKNLTIKSVRINHLLWPVSCHGCDLKFFSAGQMKTCYFPLSSKRSKIFVQTLLVNWHQSTDILLVMSLILNANQRQKKVYFDMWAVKS